MRITTKEIREIIRDVIEEGFMGDFVKKFVVMPPDVSEDHMGILKDIYKNSFNEGIDLHERLPVDQETYALGKLSQSHPDMTEDERKYLSSQFVKLVRFLDVVPKGPFFE